MRPPRGRGSSRGGFGGSSRGGFGGRGGRGGFGGRGGRGGRGRMPEGPPAEVVGFCDLFIFSSF